MPFSRMMASLPATADTTAGPLPGSASAAGLRTAIIEVEALGKLVAAFGEQAFRDEFDATCRLVTMAGGRVVVTGMGKSGLIGRKVSATLASTGTPSFFLHPADASHGDLGMIARDDVVLAFSWSGETPELTDVLDYCTRFDVPLVAVTAHGGSTLARCATHRLILPQVEEACPNRLAPTSSTTMQAALGDALAIAAIETKGFSAADFRVLHPRGSLGARLLRIGDLMAAGETIPRVTSGSTIAEATLEMTAKRLGITAVVDERGGLLGAFTDGDLRRSLAAASFDARVDDHMTRRPLTMAPGDLASEALAVMNNRSILQLLVVDGERLVGVVHLHDVLRAGVA